MNQRWTPADIPDLGGRIAVVTGANAGIGYQTATALAGRGAHVVMAVRDTAKGERARQEILRSNPDAEVEVRPLDLTSLASVRAASQSLTDDHPRIDLLVNNAGVMLTPRTWTTTASSCSSGPIISVTTR